MNPCPCGYLGHAEKTCRCPAAAIERYRARISGPFLDRVDALIEVPPLTIAALESESARGELGGGPGSSGGGSCLSRGTIRGQADRLSCIDRGTQPFDRGSPRPAASGSTPRQSERAGVREGHRPRTDHRRPRQRTPGRSRARGGGPGSPPRPPAGTVRVTNELTRAHEAREAALGLSWLCAGGIHSLLRLLTRCGPAAVWTASRRRLLEWGIDPSTAARFEAKRREFALDEAEAMLLKGDIASCHTDRPTIRVS